MPGWTDRFWKYVDKGTDDECWNWRGGVNYAGYGIFNIAGKHRTNHQYRAHRLAYELLIGPIPEGIVCCHTCDNRKCVNPAHIFLGTREDNQKDMSKKGRAAWGTRSPTARLTPRDVLEILKRAQAGESQGVIAQDYPVGRGMIGNIVRGTAWNHMRPTDLHIPTVIHTKGQGNGNARFKDEDIMTIRQLAASGMTLYSIAKRYNAGESTISSIVKRQTWKHIP